MRWDDMLWWCVMSFHVVLWQDRQDMTVIWWIALTNTHEWIKRTQGGEDEEEDENENEKGEEEDEIENAKKEEEEEEEGERWYLIMKKNTHTVMSSSHDFNDIKWIQSFLSAFTYTSLSSLSSSSSSLSSSSSSSPSSSSSSSLSSSCTLHDGISLNTSLFYS